MSKIAHRLLVRKKMLLWWMARYGVSYHVAFTAKKAAKIPTGRRVPRGWEGMEPGG